MVRPEGNSTVKAKELESIELDAISIDSSEYIRFSDHNFNKDLLDSLKVLWQAQNPTIEFKHIH